MLSGQVRTAPHSVLLQSVITEEKSGYRKSGAGQYLCKNFVIWWTSMCWKLIEELQPRYYFIENPRGGMRKMEWMKGLSRYTVTYCQYGDNRMKPTDIWTNHPDPKILPMCHKWRFVSCGSSKGKQDWDAGIKRCQRKKCDTAEVV